MEGVPPLLLLLDCGPVVAGLDGTIREFSLIVAESTVFWRLKFDCVWLLFMRGAADGGPATMQRKCNAMELIRADRVMYARNEVGCLMARKAWI